MNFRPASADDPIEINLVPLIDVLLVILIFLAATTTFSRVTQLDVTLPQASADIAVTGTINVTINREGLYALDGRLLSGNSTGAIAQALESAAYNHDTAVIVINADAQASHESVIRAMEAARMAGIEKLYFATQSPH